jgi:predicted kinase
VRTLIVTRGIPACGKSTWIEDQELGPYTISPDAIRLLYSAPVLLENGDLAISQDANKVVWKMVMETLESRMKDGHFTVIDATHTTEKALNKYVQLAKQYHYRLVCVDFSHIDLNTCIGRNARRDDFKKVPDDVIERMHEQLQASVIPKEYEVSAPTNFSIYQEDFVADDYERIHFVGDIQGCAAPLQEFLSAVLSNDLVVFVGDYLDRGPENDKVMDTLLRMPEFIYLEGNHEEHLRRWAHGRDSFSKEFEAKTRPQLEDAGIDKMATREFCAKFKECLLIGYGDKRIYVTHAGLSTDKVPLPFIATQQMTHGVGGYEFNIDKAWTENTDDEAYQVHGHRNKSDIAIDEYERSFNLEGQVEFGGALRVITLDKDGWHPQYYKNDVPCPVNPFRKEPKPLIERLRADPHILIKVYGDVLSFSHVRETAFTGRKEWDTYATRARGLFLDAKTENIIARGFDKFFYFDPNQAHKFAYPVRLQVKENGFLGLLGLHNGELFFTSKTSPTSDFTGWFRDIFYEDMRDFEIERVKKEMAEKNVCLVFEVIDPYNDPHMIEYDKKDLVLLAAVKCQEEFEEVPFDSWPYSRVQTESIIDSPEDLMAKLSTNGDNHIEGFVLIDANGKRAKVKTPFYSFWKDARSVKDKMLRAKEKGTPYSRGWEHFKNCPSDDLSIPLVEWMWKQPEEVLMKDIISVRELYLGEL